VPGEKRVALRSLSDGGEKSSMVWMPFLPQERPLFLMYDLVILQKPCCFFAHFQAIRFIPSDEALHRELPHTERQLLRV